MTPLWQQVSDLRGKLAGGHGHRWGEVLATWLSKMKALKTAKLSHTQARLSLLGAHPDAAFGPQHTVGWGPLYQNRPLEVSQHTLFQNPNLVGNLIHSLSLQGKVMVEACNLWAFQWFLTQLLFTLHSIGKTQVEVKIKPNQTAVSLALLLCFFSLLECFLQLGRKIMDSLLLQPGSWCQGTCQPLADSLDMVAFI